MLQRLTIRDSTTRADKLTDVIPQRYGFASCKSVRTPGIGKPLDPLSRCPTGLEDSKQLYQHIVGSPVYSTSPLRTCTCWDIAYAVMQLTLATNVPRTTPYGGGKAGVFFILRGYGISV